jgi:hypothetical protein
MPWFKRDEPLHERLAREAGIEQEEPQDSAPEGPLVPQPKYRLPDWLEIETLLKQRGFEWDVLVTAEAPKIAGDEVEFIALPDGSLIVDEEQGDASLDPLADAVEQEIDRPYRARGVRKDEDVWAIGARRVDLVELPAIPADHVEQTVYGNEVTTTVDGDLGPLEQLAAERGVEEYVVQADRLEGDLWEVRRSAL